MVLDVLHAATFFFKHKHSSNLRRENVKSCPTCLKNVIGFWPMAWASPMLALMTSVKGFLTPWKRQRDKELLESGKWSLSWAGVENRVFSTPGKKWEPGDFVLHLASCLLMTGPQQTGFVCTCNNKWVWRRRMSQDPSGLSTVRKVPVPLICPGFSFFLSSSRKTTNILTNMLYKSRVAPKQWLCVSTLLACTVLAVWRKA